MNIIYKVFIKFVAVFAAALSMTSCLEKIPGDYIPEKEGMKTLPDAEQTLTGIYSAYMSGSLYSGYLTLLPDIQADLVYAVQGNSNTYGTHWLWDISRAGRTFPRRCPPRASPSAASIFGTAIR